LTLWLDAPGSYSGRQIEMVAGAADEDMMTWKFPAASKLAVLTAFAVIALGLHLSAASAEPRRQYDDRGRAYYGPTGPNVSYQQGPRTRIYVTKRSWLDAGVEVLPGGETVEARLPLRVARDVAATAKRAGAVADEDVR